MRIITICSAAVCTLLLSLGLSAQNLRPVQEIDRARSAKSFEERFDIFRTPKSKSPVVALQAVGADYTTFELDPGQLGDLRKSGPQFLELELPGGVGQVDLVRADIFAAGFRVTESGREGYEKAPLGLHYRGIVAGDESSLVAISIFQKEVSGIVATKAGNLVLGKMGKDDNRHIIYNDQDLPAPDLGECGTADRELPYSAKELVDLDANRKDANNCVNLYLEADYSIFEQRGSVANVTSFLTGLFNQVAVLYANESINLRLSEINVWSSQDPYNAATSGDNLDAFQANRTTFNGDIAHLVSFQASGGVAYVDVLCSNNKRYSYGFSSISNSYATVPSYSWSVNVLAHELGHNFGSSHTHACVWNGNGTAIDGCYPTTGGCADPGIPSGGGTIMSYCHLTSAGVNFNKGFGTQPGNLIRNRAYNGSCLTSCGGTGGGDNGGGGDAGCSDNVVTITIRTDSYPGETAWTLKNANGATVASGGNYTNTNATFTTEECLADGCYTFTITDSYGDGICCSYGNGAYTVNVNGTDVATGGSFGTSEQKEICANDSSGGDDGGGDTSCDALSFGTYPPATYGDAQDKGTVTVQDDQTILLQNNAWKAINLEYTITPNTVLEFEFGATQQGEIHGIGFDNNSGISSRYTFQLFGTQSWGIGDFRNYGTVGSWKTYSIPVGQFYTGSFNRLTFTMDHDNSPRDGNSFFRNIRIYEGSTCVALAPGVGGLIEPETSESLLPTEVSLAAFPNPAAEITNLELNVPEASAASLRIIDLAGRTVNRLRVNLTAGRQRLVLPVTALPVGAYLVRLDAATGFSATAKLTVAR